MRRKKFFFWLLAGCFSILALLWLTLFGEERRDLAKTLAGKEQQLRVRNISSVLAENITASGREIRSLAASPYITDTLARDSSGADAEIPSSEALARLHKDPLSSPQPHNMMLLDLQGKIRFFAKGISLLAESDMAGWLEDIARHDTGTYDVLGPYRSTSGERFIVFSAPVYTRDGLAGRLLVAKNIVAWEELLRGRSLPKNEDSCIILNTAGYVLMAFGDSPRIGESTFSPSLKEMADMGEGTFSYEWRGKKWSGRYVALPNTDWLVLVARPESTLQAPFMKSAMAAIVVLTILLLAAFLAWAREACQPRPIEQEASKDLSMLVRKGLREGVLELDVAGRVLWANESALKILNCRTEKELLGQLMYGAPCHDAGLQNKNQTNGETNQDFVETEICPLLQSLSSASQPSGTLLTIWRKDGLPLLATHVFLPRLHGGKANGGYFIFQELFSLPANRRLALLHTFTSILDAWALFDSDLCLVEASPSLCKLFEARDCEGLRDILAPKMSQDYRNEPDTPALVYNTLKKAKKQGHAACELVLGRIPASVLPSSLPYGTVNGAGRMLCQAKVKKESLDEKEYYRLTLDFPGLRRELDTQRSFEEKLLKNILAVNPLGVVVIRDDKVIWLNRKAKDIIRLRVGDSPERAYADIGMRKIVRECLERNGRMDGCTLKVQSPAGETHEAHFAAQMLHFAGGEYCVVWIMDLSENKELLAALEAARSAADSAGAFQSEFLARLNHEMRTPLNAIMGMGYLFSQTSMTEQQRGYISKLQQGAQTLLDMINQLLDFSSVAQDALELEETTFLLPSLVEGLNSANTFKAEKKNLEFVLRVDPNIPEALTGDPVRLAQALHSLVDNAIRFTDEGEVYFEARLEQPLNPATNEVFIHFEIRDTGMGMTPETLARGFQPFGQGDGSNTREHGGVGLGLPLAQRVCRLMGGELNVESEQGKGTTVSCVLRLKRGNSTPHHLSSLCEAGSTRVLVADDNASSRAVLREQLEFLGFSVTTAASGGEALDALRKFTAADATPDLFIVDWHMPGMSGLECVCRAEGILPATCTMPMVLMVGQTRRPDEEELTRAGIAACLVKPFSPPALRETLAPLLLRKSPKETPVPLHVLLVEDNEINQEIALSLLREQGVNIDVAHNGLEAVDMVREAGMGAYALVLMDVQMPVMDGLEATSRIRGMGYTFSDLPIVAMTAQGQEEDKRQCFAAGMNDHMIKPLDPERLNAVLLRWIGVSANKPKPFHGRQNGVVFEKRASDLVSAAMQAIASEHKTSGVLIPATGLENVGGNESLYIKLLRKFFDSYAHLDKDIDTALRQGDTELAIRLAHTVKSVSASLGLADFSSISAEVERELKAGALDDTMSAAFSAGLHESLRAVEEFLTIRDIKSALAAQRSASETSSEDNVLGAENNHPAPLRARHAIALVQEILDNLELDWGVIMNNMDELERMINGSAYETQMSALSHAAENFDVPQTRTAAQHLLAELEFLAKQDEPASSAPEEHNEQK